MLYQREINDPVLIQFIILYTLNQAKQGAPKNIVFTAPNADVQKLLASNFTIGDGQVAWYEYENKVVDGSYLMPTMGLQSTQYSYNKVAINDILTKKSVIYKITNEEYSPDRKLLLVTKYGQCIRFNEKDVRSTGRVSMGVRGMNLSDNDEIIGMQMSSQGKDMLIVSEKGMGKRTSMEEFTKQNRGGKGVKCYKITEKTGNVVGAKAVGPDDEIMIINTDGIVIRMECAGISVLGRITSGVKLINLKEHEEVASIAKVRRASGELEENAEETAEEANTEATAETVVEEQTEE